MSPFKPEPEHRGGAFRDLIAVFAQPQPHKWVFVTAALAIPGLIIWAFIVQYDKEKDYVPPEVIFVKPYKTGRTDAEIRARQALDAPIERAQRKAIKDAEDARKAQFQALANDMGIDVDK